MATILNKDLIRESTQKVNDKEVIITLTAGQEIELKLKGKRGDGKAIYIKDLYAQLYDDEVDNKEPAGPITISQDKPRKRGDRKMISLYDLRSHNAISMLDIETVCKFDQIIKSVIDSHR
jgi:hypothetical protein|tara:strand:- start:602 stop:961 length:360 start_codon:yes stop_codon:yes gene_type:complete